jgi:hypothetical protein
MATVTQKLEGATNGEIPEPHALRSLLQDVQQYREQQKQEVEDSGEDEDYEAGGDDTPDTDLDDFTDKFGPDDTEQTKERLQALIGRLDEEAAGQIVLIQQP